MMDTNFPCISVIVPVYNVEVCLPECINSILAQTFTDIELVLVDDGSPDGSGIICDNYAKKDNRVKVFHQTNGGSSCARNYGLDVAKGEWIVFVDSDDYVGPDYLKELYGAVTPDVDLVISFLSHIKENGKSIPHDFRMTKNKTYYTNSIFQKMQKEWHLEKHCHPVSKLFKRKVVEESHVRFLTGVRFAEDYLFLFSFLNVIRNGVCIVPSSNYFYVDRPYSLVHQKPSFDEGLTLYYRVKSVTMVFCKKYNCPEGEFDIAYFLHRAIVVAESSKDLLKISQEDWKFFVEYFKVISTKTALDKWMVLHLYTIPSVLFFYLRSIRSFREALEKRNLWSIVDFLKK